MPSGGRREAGPLFRAPTPAGIRLGIVDGDLNIHVSEVLPSEALDHVQGIGGWPAQLIQPRLTVETFAVDHQSVAIPLAGRVTHPGRVVVRPQLTAIHEDLPPETD